MSKINEMFKNILLKKITGNLGKVEIINDEIVCYVDNRKIQGKYNDKNKLYGVNFSNAKVLSPELLNEYDINKPIYYIVEGIRFRDKLFFTAGKGTRVLFKNCKFHKQIHITSADEVCFENNKYYDRYPGYAYKNKFLSGRLNTLLFVFDNFVNSNKDHPTQFGMDIIINNFNVLYSNININENNQDSCIITQNLNIMNSKISCPSIYVICDKMNVTGSKIIASKGIIIDEKQNSNTTDKLIDVIESPSITYNGVEQKKLSTEETAKIYHRTALIKVLRSIRNSCIIEQNKELKDEEKRISQKTIGEIKR